MKLRYGDFTKVLRAGWFLVISSRTQKHTEITLPRFYPDYGLTTGDSRYFEWGGNVGDRSNLPTTKKVPHMVGCVRAEP